MEKAKYISNPFIYLSGEILIFAGIITTLIIKDFYALLLCIFVAIIYSLPTILLRKLWFRKMIINEGGITIYYKNSIVKQLLWENIKEAQATPTPYGGQISFTDTAFYQGKEKWKNYNCIFVNLKTHFAIELYKYKDKIPVEIKDLEKLHPIVQEKLKKT